MVTEFPLNPEPLPTNLQRLHHPQLKHNPLLPSNANQTCDKRDLHGDNTYPTKLDDAEDENDFVRALEAMAVHEGWTRLKRSSRRSDDRKEKGGGDQTTTHDGNARRRPRRGNYGGKWKELNWEKKDGIRRRVTSKGLPPPASYLIGVAIMRRGHVAGVTASPAVGCQAVAPLSFHFFLLSIVLSLARD